MLPVIVSLTWQLKGLIALLAILPMMVHELVMHLEMLLVRIPLMAQLREPMMRLEMLSVRVPSMMLLPTVLLL
jgi:hypothetical protein